MNDFIKLKKAYKKVIKEYSKLDLLPKLSNTINVVYSNLNLEQKKNINNLLNCIINIRSDGPIKEIGKETENKKTIFSLCKKQFCKISAEIQEDESVQIDLMISDKQFTIIIVLNKNDITEISSNNNPILWFYCSKLN